MSLVNVMKSNEVCVCRGGGGQYFNKACPEEAHKHPLQWESLQPKQTCQFRLVIFRSRYV